MRLRFINDQIQILITAVTQNNHNKIMGIVFNSNTNIKIFHEEYFKT